jgi:hypothetical protein
MYALIIVIGTAPAPGAATGPVNTYILGQFQSKYDCEYAARDHSFETVVPGLSYGMDWHCAKIGEQIEWIR